MPYRNKEYEDRFIAFIDILGFSEMIKATDNDDKPEEANENLNILLNALNTLQVEIKEAINSRELPEGTIASIFSDTIVISLLRMETYGLLNLFEILKRLQVTLLYKNVLLRGGIVRGKLIHSDRLIIGPALISAYNLESKSALYPRIVIDPLIMSLLVRENGQKLGSYKLKDYDYLYTFEKDFDGTYYIDYFNSVDEYVVSRDVNSYYDKLKELVKKYSDKRKDIGIRIKYSWIKSKIESSNYPDEIKKVILTNRRRRL